MSSEVSREGSGVRQGNNRHANIARWIGTAKWKKGKEPASLVLLCWCGDEPPDIHARWDFPDVTEQLARDISALIDGYADNAGQHCRAELQFRNDQEGVLLNSKYRGLCGNANRLGQTIAYDGSLSSMLQQNQKHTEAIIMKNLELCETIEKSRTMVHEHAALMIEISKRDAAERIERAEKERDAALERVAELEQLAEKAVSAAEASAQAAEQSEDRVTPVIKLISDKLAGSAATG